MNTRGLLRYFPHNFGILFDIPLYPDELLLFKEAIVQVISASGIGTVIISGKPSGNKFLRNSGNSISIFNIQSVDLV